MTQPTIVDSHCHLDFPDFEGGEESGEAAGGGPEATGAQPGAAPKPRGGGQQIRAPRDVALPPTQGICAAHGRLAAGH